MSVPLSDFEIQVVSAQRRVEALWMLFGWETESQRRERLAVCIDVGRSDPHAFQFLLEAVRDGVRLGCIWALVTPGRIANVWPANCLLDAPLTARDALHSTLDQHLTAADVVCGQALLPPAAEQFVDVLVNHGYRQAARLLFLGSHRNQFPKQLLSSELRFEVYREEQESRLERLIDETYSGSLDAPMLNGLRATIDVIDGYRRTGRHVPERWFFVRHQERDVGCLLLTEHRQGQQWELIYMGLVPDARGHGFGEAITRYAQWFAYEAGCNLLLLGVDAENQPAISTYTRCGFEEIDRRLALIKRFIE